MKYGQMELSVELVTPTVAKRWLELNNVNRRLRPKVVAQYLRDMAAGRWERKPIAICFDENGKLGNGQHTLHAIVESNAAVELLIARNVPSRSIAVMDVGTRRTVADVAHFLGSDLQRRSATIARILEFGVDDGESRSFEELFDAYTKHEEAIDFATNGVAHEIGFSASTLAVFARASYTQPTDKIQRFMEIVKTGIASGPSESAAIRLRDFARSQRGATSARLRAELYRKTESALQAFIAGRPLQKVYGTETELFPIPDLIKAAA